MVTSFWSVLILLVVGVIAASSVFELFSRLYQESRHARQQLAAEGETLETRLAGVAESMMNASAMLALVQTEIEARAEKARQLAAEVEERERLIELTQEQKDAVADVFRTELSGEGKRSFRWAVGLSVASLALGAVVTILVTLLVHPLT
jgi:flagellar biosynthesis/type III secretory pathway M-ring protein FliF/YscJ